MVKPYNTHYIANTLKTLGRLEDLRHPPLKVNDVIFIPPACRRPFRHVKNIRVAVLVTDGDVKHDIRQRAYIINLRREFWRTYNDPGMQCYFLAALQLNCTGHITV